MKHDLMIHIMKDHIFLCSMICLIHAENLKDLYGILSEISMLRKSTYKIRFQLLLTIILMNS